MNILKLAFKNNPKEAAKIMSNVNHDDKKISRLVKQLTNINK